MKRKLVQMGKSCLMTAIPKKWLDQHNLRKGDHVEFGVADNYLILTSKPAIISKETTINLKGISKIAIYRILSMLYDAGFTKININYNDPEALTHILWSVNVLKDWRIDPVNKNKCIIKTAANDAEGIEVVFRRAMLLTKEYINDITEYMINKKDIENMHSKHTIILSQLQSIRRSINTSIMPLEYKQYYFIALQLEEIVDHYEFLLRNMENGKKIDKEIISLQKKLSKLYDDAYTQLYNFDMEWFVNFHKENTVWKWFEKTTNSELTYHLRATSERIKNIMKHTVAIKVK